MWKALDPMRSFQVVCSAAFVLSTVLTIRAWCGWPANNFEASVMGLLGFIGTIFVLRPLRQKEADNFAMMLPARLNVIRNFVGVLTRR